MEMETNMSETAPKTEVIFSFITQITQNWKELPSALIEIRAISPVGSIQVARFSADNIEEVVKHSAAMNKAKQNIYMCINPVDAKANIQTGKAAKDVDILSALYCFADADTEGAMENILSFAGPKFTMSVKTGTKPSQEVMHIGCSKSLVTTWTLGKTCRNQLHQACKQMQQS
mgnify:CR=1 FL=1